MQKYCAQGRIAGVKKFGVSWGIPVEAVKPQDPRKLKSIADTDIFAEREMPYPGLMPLMNMPFEPGRCLEYIEAMEDGDYKKIALAEYHYFSGSSE